MWRIWKRKREEKRSEEAINEMATQWRRTWKNRPTSKVWLRGCSHITSIGHVTALAAHSGGSAVTCIEGDQPNSCDVIDSIDCHECIGMLDLNAV